jgi:hypothetical protein
MPWRWRCHQRRKNLNWSAPFDLSSWSNPNIGTVNPAQGTAFHLIRAMILALRGKRFIETRPLQRLIPETPQRISPAGVGGIPLSHSFRFIQQSWQAIILMPPSSSAFASVMR